MDIFEKIRKTLEKLQSLSDIQKKMILWSVVAIFAAIMGYFWAIGTVKSFKTIGEGVSQIKLPDFQMPPSDIIQTTTPSNENPIIQALTQDQTASWKTYTSNEYNFQIKYPADWQRTSANIKNVFDDVVFCPVADKSCSGLDQIYLVLYKENQGNNNAGSNYLGTQNGLYYYLDVFPQADESIGEQMALTFKFLNK